MCPGLCVCLSLSVCVSEGADVFVCLCVNVCVHLWVSRTSELCPDLLTSDPTDPVNSYPHSRL